MSSDISKSKKERRRLASETESERKRSKFNLKLERVGPNSSKTLTAAGNGLKWLFTRKKSKSSKELNVANDDDATSNSSFINPIPIVAAAAGGHSHFSVDNLSTHSQQEMSERVDLYDEILETRSLKNLSRKNSQEDEETNYCKRDENLPQQRLVSMPKALPQDRIAYEFNQDPHLHNFHLQGNQSHLPQRKMIFRPSSYPNIAHNAPQIQHQQLQVQYRHQLPNQNQSYHVRMNGRLPGPSSPGNNYMQMQSSPQPRGPGLAHVRGPFPPPQRILRPNNPSNFNQIHRQPNHALHLHQPQQQRSPRPRGPSQQQQTQVHHHQQQQNYNYNNGQQQLYPPSNFPNHHPNLLRHPPPSGNANYVLQQHQIQQNQSNVHIAQQKQPKMEYIEDEIQSAQMSYLKPPIPKQRKSLTKKSCQDVGFQVDISNSPNSNEPPWIIVPKDHKLPRLPVPIGESHQRQSVIENMRNLSSSCTSLSTGSNNRKSSSNSRNSKISNDSAIAIPWFRWFASRLEKDEGIAKKSGSSEKKKSDLNSNCIRCNKKLPDLTKGLKGVINAPVSCSICSLKVCKSCAVWDQSKNSYSCGHCHPPKSIDKRKSFWFDNISPGAGTNFASAERDTVTENVREHLERIIESQVEEGIDTVPLIRLFDHPQYDLVFHRFHEELSDALVNLGFSLKLAIENKPMNETPTSAHTTLTDLLSDIKSVAIELPVMEVMNKTEAAVELSQQNGGDSNKEIQQPSYEDVLATAVINKAIINGQKLRKVDSPMSLVDSAVQTDSEMSENSDANSHNNKYNVRGWVTNLEKTPPQHHPNLSDDDLSMGTSSSNWSNEAGNMQGGHQVVIEEQVEEITTTYESDSDIPHPPVRNRKGRKTARQRNNENSSVATNVVNDDTLLGVDLTAFDSRVPFPEGGVDIVPRSKLNAEGDDLDIDDDPTGILVSQISEWEQNWLFKRRKQLLLRRNLMAEAVPMLVPNPNDDENYEVRIGEEKISDLSDLSDHVNEDEDSFDSENESESETEVVEDAQNVGLEKPKISAENSNIVVAHKLQGQGRRISNASTNSVNDSSATEDSSSKMKFNKPAPKKVVKKVEKPGIKLLAQPNDIEVDSGRTARFSCIISEDSPECSVAWFCDGQLITTKDGKFWAYSRRKNEHYLYIYDCNEKDSGKYHIALFDYKGNATKHHFNLSVTTPERRKPESPTFTFLQDIVSADKIDAIVSIPFELTGYPEPFLQVFRNEVEISKLSHVSLDDKGDGKWSLELRKKETDFTVYGEYVAEAKNSQGKTRVTFRLQEGPTSNKVSENNISNVSVQHQEKSPTVKKLVNGNKQRQEQDASPSPVPRPVSAASEDSSIGETLRENSYTLNRNQTLIKEDYEADLLDSQKEFDPSKMSVAEREKLKWANPVNLPNNPYAPENLAKRIRQRENGGFKLPSSATGDVSVTSSDEERSPIVERSHSLNKFARDYYVPNQQTQKVRTAIGPNFGSSRSLSLTSNSSREGSNEKDSGFSSVAKSSISSTNSKPTISSVNFNKMTPTPSDRDSKVPFNKQPTKATNYEENGHGRNGQNGISPEMKTPSEMSPTPRKNGNSLETGSSSERDSLTPSPRQRRHNSDLGSLSAHRDGAELKQIRLPSVKNLAKQFQVPEEKPQPIPELKPSNGHVPRVFHKDPNKSYQQLNQKPPRRPSDLAFAVVHKTKPQQAPVTMPSQPKRIVTKQPERKTIQAPKEVTQQQEFKTPVTSDARPVPAKTPPIATEHQLSPEPSFDNSEKDFVTPSSDSKSDFSTPFPSNPVTPNTSNSLIELESDTEVNNEGPPPLPKTPPPLPMTPPPPKTPITDENQNILSLLEELDKNPEKVEFIMPTSWNNEGADPDATGISASTPDFGNQSSASSISFLDSPLMNLPEIPMFLPTMETPTSTYSEDATSSFDFKILDPPSQDTSLMSDETPPPKYDSLEGEDLHAELVKLKESNAPQPLYKVFNEIPLQHKNENETLPNNNEYSSPKPETQSVDLTPRNPLLKSNDLDSKSSGAIPDIIKIEATTNSPTLQKRSNNRTKSIVAKLEQFEANEGTIDRSATLPRMRTADNDDFLKEASERRQREEEEKAQSLRIPVRRPTAMEVLATPTHSLQDDEIDLKRLRRSILRGARSGEGLKGNQNLEILPASEGKNYNRSKSVSEDKQSEGRRERPKSLVTSKSVDSRRSTEPQGKVHSLTARSVSLKFRENLKKSQPDHTDINIKLKSSNVNGKSSNNSDSTNLNENEKEISNNRDLSNGGGTRDIDPDSAPGELSRKKGGSSSNILARAAFWDKRVHEEIIDDKLVIKEFPKMEI